jgi:hypothetical protein
MARRPGRLLAVLVLHPAMPNHAIGFGFIALGAAFVFKPW